jgi:hypothetical protein
MIPLTVPEVRRLLDALLLRTPPPGHAIHWLTWRRRHQARARRHHQRTRLELAAQLPIPLVSYGSDWLRPYYA